MKNGSLWITGLVLLLFAFCALEFRAVHKTQSNVVQQVSKLNEAIQSLQGAGRGPAGRAGTGQPAISEKSLEALSLDMQNFMRDMRSRQTGFERRLADLDDRINHERETILVDLKSFIEDMRTERQEFSKEIRVSKDQLGEGSSEAQKISDLLAQIDEKIKELGRMIEAEGKRREEMYQQETEGVKIEGKISGPGADTRKSYP